MLIEIFGIFNLFGSARRPHCDRHGACCCCRCQPQCVRSSLTVCFCRRLSLCSNFFPIVLSIFRNLPVIGPLLNLPLVQRVLDRIMGATLPTHMASA